MRNMFSMFNTFSIFGNTKKKYNPYINYTWQMLPNAKVKNSGTSGVDLQLYSGNPLDFQGSQEIAIGNTFGRTFSIVASGTFDLYIVSGSALTNVLSVGYSTYNGVRFRLNTSYQYIWENVNIKNVKSTIIINATDTTIELFVNGVSFGIKPRIESISSFTVDRIGSTGASGYMDGDFDYLTFSNSVLTQQQITQSVDQPNQFFKDMSTNSNTLFCTDFRGNVGYIADSKNYSEINIVTDSSNWVLFNNTKGTITTTGPNSVSVTVTSTALFDTRLVFSTNNSKYRIINISYTITANSGSNGFTMGTSGNSKLIIRTNGTYTDTYIVPPDSAPSIIIGWYGGTEEIGDKFTINSLKILETSNIYPITNYSTTQRTNFTQVNKGLQDLTRKFDSNGFFVDNVSYLNCNGKGYGDTGWVPSSVTSATIEYICYIGLSGYYLSGTKNPNFRLGSNNGNTFFQTAVTSISTNTNVNNNNYNLLTMEYNQIADNINCYVNGVFVGNKTIGNISVDSLVFELGKTGNEYYLKTPIKLFKVHNKALTQAEITKNYNNYVEQGLLA